MSETVTTTMPSGITYLVPKELLGYLAQCGQEPEKSLIEWARRFLRPEGVFVDIGAHIGTYALSYAPEVKQTHAFEPQRDTFYRLCGGIALRGNDTVSAHNVAIGDANNVLRTLRVLTTDGGLSSVCELPTNAHPARTEWVTERTLDSFGIDAVCLVKIDVEGNELAVLQGARNTLHNSDYPPLLVEVWTEDWFAAQRAEIHEYLTHLGYGITPAPGFPHMWVCEHEARKDKGPPGVENIPEDSLTKKRLLLTMIVKNESRVIERGLETMLPHVDGYSICDTGSTDGTPALIARIAEKHGVRGTVHRTEWKNYGHNRTESAGRAIEWARARGWALEDTYLLFLDADMQLRVESFDRQALTEDSYMVLQGNPGNLYPNTRLARADFAWQSHGVTHEFWGAEGAVINAHLKRGLWLEDGNDGGNRGTKFERDRALLEQGLVDEPTNERYMFYLAQTYFDLGEYDKAAQMYERRWKAGGYQEERMYARMKQGLALLRQGDRGGVDVLLRAFQEFPHRCDPLFHLAVHFREQGQNGLAQMLIERARAVPPPDPTGLFIEQDIYEWRLDWEESIVGYYTGNVAGARAAADRISRFRRPGIDYEHLARNLMHYTEPLVLLEKGLFQVPEEVLRDPVTGTKYESSSPTLCPTPYDGKRLVGVRLVNYDHAQGTWFNSKDADRVIRTRQLTTLWNPRDGSHDRYIELDQNVPGEWPAAAVLGLEDQRYVWHRDHVWFTANSWQTPHGAGQPQMVLGRLTGGHEQVDRLLPLRWAGMRPIEKNWLPFVDVGRLRLVYGYDPLIVLDVDTETGECTEVARHPSPWFSGRFRGSTGPVRIPGSEGWLLFVHEVTVLTDPQQRIYGQRLIELDRTYKPVRLSAPFYIDHRGVEFPLGFVSLDVDVGDGAATRAIITYGREERESAYAIVAWDELLSRLTP